MKKILSVLLVVCLAFSICALTACGEQKPASTNLYEDFEKFDSYVDENSAILGTWKMTAPDTDKEWTFFPTTTVHQTKIVEDISTSDVGTFNYTEETGVLKTYIFTGEREDSYTVEINGNKMTLTTAEGDKLTFEKQ